MNINIDFMKEEDIDAILDVSSLSFSVRLEQSLIYTGII